MVDVIIVFVNEFYNNIVFNIILIALLNEINSFKCADISTDNNFSNLVLFFTHLWIGGFRKSRIICYIVIITLL